MALSQKSAISFALVHIPVELHVATSKHGIRFNQLSKKTKARVKYKKVDESTGKELSNDDIVKAYQYDKHQYVEMTDADFESIKTEKDRTIQIVQFTDLATIPPVYFERSYHCLPQKGGERAFELLRQVMLRGGKVAIGKTVMGSTETIMALMPTDDGILLQTMYYGDEVRSIPRPVARPEVAPMELEMGQKLLAVMDKPFDPDVFKDEYQDKLANLIESKVAGKKVTIPPPAQGGSVIDLMEMLQASVGQQTKVKRQARGRKKAG